VRNGGKVSRSRIGTHLGLHPASREARRKEARRIAKLKKERSHK